MTDTPPDGWMLPDSMEWLEEQAAKVEAMAAEIGVWKGRSTWALLRGLRSGRVLYAIDPWGAALLNREQAKDYPEPGKAHAEFIRRFAPAIRSFRLLVCPTHSWTAAEELAAAHGYRCLDFVFIDGDHSYFSVCRDIAMYLPLVRRGGLLAGHDYSGDVKRAVDHMLGTTELGPDSIWSYRV